MKAPELPPDLAEIEALLCARAAIRSPGALRARVLGAVARERTWERRVRVATLAASLLVALGLWTSLPERGAARPRSLGERELALLEGAGIDRDLARRLELPPPTPLAPPLRGS